jgi:aldose 1-epimerase
MLHGGEDAYDQRTFTRLDIAGKGGEAPSIFSAKELKKIAALPAAEVWTHTSPSGDEGFPGTLRIEVLTALIGSSTPSSQDPQSEYPLGAVLIIYRAKLIDGTTPTPVNLTQHWGFNLDASLNARKSRAEREKGLYGGPLDDVRAHTLSMPADAIIGLDADALSTGKLEPVQGGRDFTKGKTIGEGWPQNGYDEFFAWEKPVSLSEGKLKFGESELGSVDVVSEVVDGSAPVMTTLAGAKSGLKVEFRTNQSGVQFYTANFYDRSNARKKIHGGTGVKATGDGYGPGAAAFLEFHEPLAAFLPENAGTIRNGFDTLIAPGEIYSNWVRADVICKSVPEEDA